ncbi:MAG: UbiD family decarboxylase [Thermincola sp.]|jgi:4-hydroxy-3-polyprenylbenzoate decarboxylase|nr:UbiD family decarboxylase [Thermincola sp.]MDT3701436.1 UbiD family decarboxylase [Thermincola sp.]
MEGKTYNGLREWLKIVEDQGELRTVLGANAEDEIGALTDEVCHSPQRYAVLFDKIQGYQKGFRILVNSLGSVQRLALSLGLSANSKGELVERCAAKLDQLRLLPTVTVKEGPVLENRLEGEQVDLEKFPVPFWHKEDGGRYIGTGSVTITKDPDTGWVNLGTYRIMTVGRDRISFYISPGKHGLLHREKFFDRGQPCPVVVSLGHDPLILAMGSFEWPYGMNELELAGGFRGSPVEVIQGPYTGLLFPAHSEIVLEGEALPDEKMKEGPFGEWTGYYASGSRLEVTIRVKAIYHRHDPIMLGAPPFKPPNGNSFYLSVLRAAKLKLDLQKIGAPDVRGVWFYEEGGGRLMTAISLKQKFPGHAKQVAMLATAAPSANYMGRYVIVVDDDIDVTDLREVIWAICTRTDPVESIDIIRRCWSTPLDPAIAHDKHSLSSRAIIDACRPFERRDSFPKVISTDPQLIKNVRQKWPDLFR